MGKIQIILQNLQKSINRHRQNFIIPFQIPSISVENLLDRMPSKNVRFCNCFGSQEPPEITMNGILEQNIIVQPPPANLNSEELEEQFAEFVEELDLTAVNKNAMLSLPLNKKWQIYASRIVKNNETDTLLSFSPEYFIDRISALKKMGNPQETPKLFESLRTSLRTQPNSFVQRFLDLEGLNILLETLASSNFIKYHPGIIQCIKSLLNNSTGRAYVLAHPLALNITSESLTSDNLKCKVDVFEILGACCLVPGGHRKVLSAISYLQEFASERTRFQTILNDLDRSTGGYKTDISVKTAIMSFINAILSYGPGQSCLEFRLHIRYELLMLGLQPIIDKLRKFDNETLDKHLDFFEMMRLEDEKEFAKRFDQTHIDSKNTQENFNLINAKLSHSSAYANLQSIIHHLLLLPIEITHHWTLIDRLIQQVTLQTESKDPDNSYINIDVDTIVKQLASEEQLNTALKKVEQLSAENMKLANSSSLKEQELEIRTQEKENLEKIIKTLREKLKEANNRAIQNANAAMQYNAMQNNNTFQNNNANPQAQLPASNISNNHHHQNNSIMNNLHNNSNVPMSNNGISDNTVPSEASTKVELMNSHGAEGSNNNNSIICRNNSTETASSSPSASPQKQIHSNIPCPPPPPPFPTASSFSNSCPGPPPPPPLMQNSANVPKKPVPSPIPKTQLKALNWSKLPETKINGTIWMKIDESNVKGVYNQLDLSEIDRLFSAYKHVNGVLDKDPADPQHPSNSKQLKKVISVIDGRRAQNCTILLSKLKMTDEEITRAILSMDQMNQLPLDMIEQLLKFTPNNEEKQLLEEQEIEYLARADTFLLHISRIPHYSERLRSIHYKKRFPNITAELKTKLRTITQSLLQLQTSKKLQKMLELILALGNYMNNGTRGNAAGFRLNSLIRIQDTKSNSKINLMNYLIMQLETSWPDLLDIELELSQLKTAAKVNMNDLDKEMHSLRSGMNLIEKEVEFHRSVKMEPGDRFLIAMREFTSTATSQLLEIEDSFSTMKSQFHKTLQFFGEDYTTTDEFLLVFDQFLTNFQEARIENENLRKRKEDESKRAENATLRRNTTKSSTVTQAEKGEFDDLISALRTGDVFTTSDTDIKNYKRKRAVSQRVGVLDQRERIH